MSYFKNKTFLITGGSEGIGLCLAELICQNGGHVTILSRNVDKLEKAVASVETKNSGAQIKPLQGDVTSETK